MIFQFDPARLDCFQRESLLDFLDIIQSENVGEIVVRAVELPYKFLVLVDGDVESLWGLERDGGRAYPLWLNLTRSRNRNRNRNRNRIRSLIQKRNRKRSLNRKRIYSR